MASTNTPAKAAPTPGSPIFAAMRRTSEDTTSFRVAIGLVGDIGTVRGRLGEYASAGLDEIALDPATAGDPGAERTLSALADLG